MIDTIGLESPPISDEVVTVVEQFLNKFIGIEVGTGLLKYEFFSGQLQGSYDSRISVQIKRERFISTYDVVNSSEEVIDEKSGKKYFARKKKPVHRLLAVPSDPYLCIECSVHKSILGHNVSGGSSDFLTLCKWLVQFVEKIISVELPYYEVWMVRRVDVAEIFNLGSFEAVEEYIRGLKHAYYPRRTVVAYKFESIYVSGAKSTLKFYHKGPEFSRHDRKRLLRCGLLKMVDTLQILANNILRVEVEVKSKKLRDVFEGRLPYVGEITGQFLADCYSKEVFKLLRERVEPDSIEIYRTTESVSNRLNELHSTKLSRALYKTWITLASLGEDRCKSIMSKDMFYRHRKLLIASNVSWLQSDILVNEQYSSVPSGFMPVLTDSHRLVDVDLKMIKELRKVAA